MKHDLPMTPKTHCLKTRVKSMRTANLDPNMLTCQHTHEESDRRRLMLRCPTPSYEYTTDFKLTLHRSRQRIAAGVICRCPGLMREQARA